MNFASAGIGAASHLAAEKFNVAAGIKSQHVPFKGPVEALTEVMAGRIDYYFLPIAPALALIKERQGHGARGQLRQARAVAAGRADHRRGRLSEGGLCVLERRVRAGEDAARTSSHELYDETQKAVADPGVKERLAKLGIEPLVMSQPEFQKYFEADVKDTDELAKAARHRKAITRMIATRAVALLCRVRPVSAGACGERCGADRLADQADPRHRADRARHRRRRGGAAGVQRACRNQLGQQIVIENRGGAGGTHRLGRGRQGRSRRLHASWRNPRRTPSRRRSIRT